MIRTFNLIFQPSSFREESSGRELLLFFFFSQGLFPHDSSLAAFTCHLSAAATMSLCWWIPGKTWECGPKLGAQTYEWLTKVHSYMGMFHWTERVACTFRFEWSEPSYWLSVTLLLSMSWFSGKWDISKTQYVYKHKCPLPLNHDFQGRWPGLLKFWWILKRCLRGTYSKLCRQGQGPHIFFGRHAAHWEAPGPDPLWEEPPVHWQFCWLTSSWNSIKTRYISLYNIYIYIFYLRWTKS